MAAWGGAQQVKPGLERLLSRARSRPPRPRSSRRCDVGSVVSLPSSSCSFLVDRSVDATSTLSQGAGAS